jgi:hypothetical protein
MSQNPLQQQASKAADAPPSAGAQKNLEVERLAKRARDLRIGLRNITEMERRGVNCDRRRAMQASKLARVEARIFRLLQMSLF